MELKLNIETQKRPNMTNLDKTSLRTTFLLLVMATIGAGIGACGQKGPLIVEEPPIDQVTTQKEELEETK